MNADQMTKLADAAKLLRQAKVDIEAVRDAVAEEQDDLPERLHGGDIDDDADDAFVSLQFAAMSIAVRVVQPTGEDDPKPSDRPEPLSDNLPPSRRR